jgi:DNA-binding MarR family transcriptional regulator
MGATDQHKKSRQAKGQRAKTRREQQLEFLDAALFRISGSSIRGRELALEDLKWQTRVELTTASYPVLNQLVHGPLRLTDLAAALYVSGPAVSRQVSILHDKGLVERLEDENDARATIVQLSPKGAEVLAEAAASRLAMLHQVLAGWSDDEVEQMTPILTRLADELAKWDHR